MKVFNDKNKQMKVVFNEYQLNGSNICPECQRALNSVNISFLNTNGKLNCPKCGAKLKK